MNYKQLLKQVALVVIPSVFLLQAGNASAVPLQLLFESDADDVGGSEIFLASFDSTEAFLNFDLANSAASDIDITPGFSVGGFAFDGSYQLLLESDVDDAGGSEILLASFDTIEAFLNFDLANSAFSDIDITPGFSVGGFTFDGSYQLLLESDVDDAGGSELFLATFNSLDAFLNFDLADSAFSDIDVTPGFSVGGLATPFPEVTQVPEPGSAILVGVGLLALSFFALRRRPTNGSKKYLSAGGHSVD